MLHFINFKNSVRFCEIAVWTTVLVFQSVAQGLLSSAEHF